MPTWLQRPGADIEILAENPQEAVSLETKYKANPNDPAVEGRVRFKQTPKPPAEGSDLDIVGRFKQWATAPPPAGSQRAGGLGPVVRRIGDIVLPGSIPAAVVQSAIPLAGRVGGLVTRGAEAAGAGLRLSRAAGVATKFLTPAVTGGVTAGATGESVSEPVGGGLLASTVAAIPAGIGGATGWFARRFSNVEGPKFAAAVRDYIGPKLAQAFEEELPSIPVRNTSDLLRLTREETGRGVLAKKFDLVEGQIDKLLGKQPSILLPAEAVKEGGKAHLLTKVVQPEPPVTLFDPRGKPMQSSPPTKSITKGVRQVSDAEGKILPDIVPVTGKEAIEIAKVLRDKGRRRGGEGIVGLPARQMAEEVQTTLENAVTRKNKPLASRYAKLRDEYGKFMDLRDVLIEDTDKLFPALPKGGPTIDLVELRRRLINNPRFSPERYPGLAKFLGGGEAFGTGPAEAPGMFIPRVGHSVGGAYVGEPAKRVTRTELPAAYQPRGGAHAVAEGAPKVGRAVGTAVGIAVAGPAASPPTPEDLMLEQLKTAP